MRQTDYQVFGLVLYSHRPYDACALDNKEAMVSGVGI